MHKIFAILAGAFLAFRGGAALARNESASGQTGTNLADFTFTLGEFIGEKKMEDGRTYRVRTTGEWWLGRKSIIGRLKRQLLFSASLFFFQYPAG